MKNDKTILVFGATGRMGGAVARHLHRYGWCVKGISRNPDSEKANALMSEGIEVIQGDMDYPETLRSAFAGAFGLFLSVNWVEAGIEGELRQGKHVADLATEANIEHLVFGAAGTGKRGTGLPHFDVKIDIVEYLRSKGVPTTVIYPPPFMELMTDPTLYPQLGTWNAKMKIVGKNLSIPWIATDDIGALVALIFSTPGEYIGKDLNPVGDWKTMGECLELYRHFVGKRPFRIPFPIWVMRPIIPDLVKLWEWMASVDDMRSVQNQPLSELLDDPTDVRLFLEKQFEGS